LQIAIHDSQVALSVSVLGRENLCTMPWSKKNRCVDLDVICVPRSDAAIGRDGASSPSNSSLASALSHALRTAQLVCSGPK
jgi:hypothetical protein